MVWYSHTERMLPCEVFIYKQHDDTEPLVSLPEEQDRTTLDLDVTGQSGHKAQTQTESPTN